MHHVAADVADLHPPLLGQPVHDLDELAPALLGERGDGEADEVAVVGGVQPEVGVADRLLDRLDRGLVVGLDGQQLRLGRVDRGQLAQRRRRAVVVDLDAVQQRRRRPAGAHGVELALRGLDRLAHAVAGVGEEFVDQLTHWSPVISVPTRSPDTIRSMLRSSSMLKTLIGRSFSMHSVSAVRSMTRRRRSSASM